MKKVININIWDDYWDDGHIPEGKIQETFAYVEDSEISLERQKEILTILRSNILTSFGNMVQSANTDLYLRDTREIYNNLPEGSHSINWRLNIKHLTHKDREELVKDLQNMKLTYAGIPFDIYSES